MWVSSLNVASAAEMATVYIGVGSNIDRDESIRAGIKMLRQEFNNVRLSRIYESSAVGFEGDNFYNLVAAMETDLNPQSLQDKLHEIESQFGRVRGGPRYVSRTLDLDLLLYDDLVCDEDGLQLPREDVSSFAFVLLPLSEIAGEQLHPQSQISYADMWRDFEQQEQALWPVEIDV